MNQPTIYLLLYNGNVEQASKSVKILWSIIANLCQVNRQELPLSYVQVTRLMNENNCYVHSPAPMTAYTIIERKLLFTHRKKVVKEGAVERGLTASA